MRDLENKVVIVTGASSGIGFTTAEALLSLGAKVFGCDVAPAPASLLADNDNEKSCFWQCDLRDKDAPKQIVQKCREAFGDRIDGLCNIAGVMDNYSSVDTFEDESWDRMFAINVTAPARLTREVVPFMLKNQRGGGSIVNMGSFASLSGAAAGIAYTASKHAVVGMTKNIAFRFMDDKIRCNAVCPGGVHTNIFNTVDPSTMDLQAQAKAKPIFDYGIVHAAMPKEIADVIVFLISDMSRHISGAVIPVDAGLSTL
ncbi:uncharacterized protein PV06_05802 [Exophiala oligosperma]|uniref:Uncharacterized protein n=1 Tax=Exophiala oligosperma TaxID=215243 RepID=A0A0D2DGU2_9EURO|nr:uncharacterized protein PV06_05802 [Exophiala oligosperma]KIW42238.1 hypothetical protein PV06_05802 [Exophiala oligosperma]